MDELEKIRKKIARIDRTIESITTFGCRRLDSDEYYNYLLSIVKELEDVTVKMRNLPVYRSTPKEIMENGRYDQEQPVIFERIGEILKVTLPRLLPERKNNPIVKKYLVDCYYAPIRRYFTKNPMEITEKKLVLWYVHCFPSDKQCSLHDYSNVEEKIITDMLSSYIMPDDSPVFCDLHASCKQADEFKTEIYIIPAMVFADFYGQFIQTGSVRS